MSELKTILATPHPKMKNACDGAIEVYPKSEADKVIVEKDMEIFNLKEELSYIKADSTFDRDEYEELLKSKDAEIAELQKQVHDYAQGLYVIQARAEKEIRRLKRALYKACANWAHAEYRWSSLTDWGDQQGWAEMERKCRARAEELEDK